MSAKGGGGPRGLSNFALVGTAGLDAVTEPLAGVAGRDVEDSDGTFAVFRSRSRSRVGAADERSLAGRDGGCADALLSSPLTDGVTVRAIAKRHSMSKKDQEISVSSA